MTITFVPSTTWSQLPSFFWLIVTISVTCADGKRRPPAVTASFVPVLVATFS